MIQRAEPVVIADRNRYATLAKEHGALSRRVKPYLEYKSVAAAITQAVKAFAIARGVVAPAGMDLVCVPAFADVQIDGEDRTAIKLIVSPR